jgi:succinate dehydrogenase hydrophobic anchor subunit
MSKINLLAIILISSLLSACGFHVPKNSAPINVPEAICNSVGLPIIASVITSGITICTWMGMNNITEDHVSPNTGSTLGALIKIIVMLILGLSTATFGLYLMLELTKHNLHFANRYLCLLEFYQSMCLRQFATLSDYPLLPVSLPVG